MKTLSEEILEQNKMLKGLLTVMVEMLPTHSPDCYGLRVHPGNCTRCCDCDMDEIREKVRKLL